MRRLIQIAIWIYPPSWRRRYAREFEALLDDVNPGVRELLDVLKGALTMQFRTLGANLVLCALIGATVGAFVAIRTPSIYSSSALLLLRGVDEQNPESVELLTAQGLNVGSLSEEERMATSISFRFLKGSNPHQTAVLKVSYKNRDAIQAQRVTARLVTALTSSNGVPWQAQILDSPVVPNRPIKPNYLVTTASGSIVGLVIGGIAVLAFRMLRRPAKAH